MTPPGPLRLRAPAFRLAPGLLPLVLALGLSLPARATPQADPPAGPSASAAPPAAPPAPTPRAAPLPEPPAPPPSLPATEAEQSRGLTIVAIQFLGLRRMVRDDQLARMQERPGQPFSPETLTRDVRELWNTGFFDDIEVDLERADKGVVLRFQVRERPSVKAIEFEGNNELEADKLTEAIDLKVGAVISYPALRKAIQKIRDMYAEKGYFLAEASFEVVPQRDGEIIVRFLVKEHEQVSVRRVTFIGNNSIPEEQLREVLITGASSIFSFGSGGPFRQDAFDRDIFILSSLYYDRGFLSVQMNAPRIMLTPDRSGIELAITINEGPQYRIRTIRLLELDNEGKEIEPIGGRRHLREMVRFKTGDIFNRTELAKDLQDVQTLYQDAGYANAKAEPATDIDQDRREVDVVVPIQRGPLVHFGRIEIRGNSKTRDKVIRRELEIAEGDLFGATKLERSRRRVMSLGYFERVDISTEQSSGDPTVRHVNIEVTERPTGTFQVGAGFSSIESFIATAQVQQANLFGTGQSLSIQGQVSGLRQLINIRWFEPYFLDTNFSASIDLFDQLRIYNDFSQSSLGGSLTFGYPLIDPTVRAFVAYSLQQDKVSTETTSTFLGTASSVSVFQRLPLANLFNYGITSSVRPTLTYDTRDNRLFPTSGVYLSGSVELASSAFGSQNEFIRYRTTGRFYYPLGGNVVLKLNTESGVVTSPSSSGVPIFARFFLGGILDVRGYRLRTLGPRLPLNAALDPNSRPITNGANIGGNLMYYQNLELEFPIIQQVGVRGVIFTDLGNAWNLERLYCDAASGGNLTGLYSVNTPCFSFPNSLGNVRTSWGMGLRWFSPLGPLRFEWGFPFKPLPYEESSVFEFTIGNFF